MLKPNTWIVKIGGSLLGSAELAGWLRELARLSDEFRIIIVPGGGVFADSVRETQKSAGFSDEIAHQLALLSMRQFGCVVAGELDSMTIPFEAVEALSVKDCAGLYLWDPLDVAEQASEMPRDWRVTSDSLSLWLCEYLSPAHLLLVKSGPPNLAVGDARQLSTHGFVDAYFATLLSRVESRVWWIEKSHVAGLATLFAHGDLCSECAGEVI